MSIDRSNNTEIQNFNKLLKQWEDTLLGSNTPTEKPEDLEKQFSKIQSDIIEKGMINKMKVGKSTNDQEIPATDVRSFFKKISGE